MIWLVIIGISAAFILNFSVRCAILHPILTISHIPKDIYNHFVKYFWIPQKPFINVYCGLFGSGKTLSAVHDVRCFYNKYNDRKVFDDRIGKYVTQKVQIVSNVDLVGIPYIPFTGLKQIVEIAKVKHERDAKNKVRTVTIILGDEFSVQMNSRSFKTNIDPLFLNALLTSRHSLIHGFYLTSQRFEHMDALLRQVSTNVIECKKLWRFQKNTYYDAYLREHATDPQKVEKMAVTGFFVTNKDFETYNTLQIVKNLVKSCENDDLMSTEEIINNISLKDRYLESDKKSIFGREKKKK